MLKKRRRKRKTEKTNKQKQTRCKNYKESIGTKLITNTRKQKLKIQSRVLNFKNTMLKKRKKRHKERKQTNKNNVAKTIKKIQVQI